MGGALKNPRGGVPVKQLITTHHIRGKQRCGDTQIRTPNIFLVRMPTIQYAKSPYNHLVDSRITVPTKPMPPPTLGQFFS